MTRPGAPGSLGARVRRSLQRAYGAVSGVVFGAGAGHIDARDVQSYFRTTSG